MSTGPATHDLTRGIIARLPEDADIGGSEASGLTPGLDAFCLDSTTDSTRHLHEAWTALAKRLEDRSGTPPMPQAPAGTTTQTYPETGAGRPS